MTKVLHHIESLRVELAEVRRKGDKIGLVPTMGALHQGHAQLIKEALKDNDLVVVSIFVNPAQFNNPEDLIKYPRDVENDLRLLEKLGCHLAFVPEVAEMYPTAPMIKIGFGPLESTMEGAFREGHFQGVGLVVAKLFNIVHPHRAYFGQKDLQQFTIIQALVDGLNFDLELKCIPIVRESGGLAISSRNQRLTSEEKLVANNLYKSLLMAEKWLKEGMVMQHIRKKIIAYLGQWQEICLEYIELVQQQNLESRDNIKEEGPFALCIAAQVGEVRLIDNIIFNK